MKYKNYRSWLQNQASELLQLSHKLEKWQRCHNLLIWGHCQLFFDVVLYPLSSLVAGPSFMSIQLLVLELGQFLFIRHLTRYPKIENTLVWVSSNIWRLWPVRGTKFVMNVSNKKLLNAAKYQVCNYHFWVVEGKIPRFSDC